MTPPMSVRFPPDLRTDPAELKVSIKSIYRVVKSKREEEEGKEEVENRSGFDAGGSAVTLNGAMRKYQWVGIKGGRQFDGK